MVMKEMPGLRETHILIVDIMKTMEVVQRETPEVLTPFQMMHLRIVSDLPSSTSSDHPLLARVTINRYWQMIFGRGLVSTSEDFGMQETSSHPELMDWLAEILLIPDGIYTNFEKDGFIPHTGKRVGFQISQKRMILKIYFLPFPIIRLPAEMIRDGLLSHSNLLHKKVGGPGAKPYDLKVSFKPMNPDGAPNVYRRSMYTYWKRTGPTPVMMAPDASKRDVCTVRRERTDSPSQSLILLNGTQFVEAARAFADQLILEFGKNNPVGLANEAFRQLTSRYPTEQEAIILLKLLSEQKEHFTDPKETEKFLNVGYYKAKSKDNSHLAAVTTFVSTLMNFDETLSKR